MFGKNQMQQMLNEGISPATVAIVKWEGIRKDGEEEDWKTSIGCIRLACACALCHTYDCGRYAHQANLCPLVIDGLRCNEDGHPYTNVVYTYVGENRAAFIAAVDVLLAILRRLVAEGN